MPGAYAHITAANKASERMDGAPGFPPEGQGIVLDCSRTCSSWPPRMTLAC